MRFHTSSGVAMGTSWCRCMAHFTTGLEARLDVLPPDTTRPPQSSSEAPAVLRYTTSAHWKIVSEHPSYDLAQGLAVAIRQYILLGALHDEHPHCQELADNLRGNLIDFKCDCTDLLAVKCDSWTGGKSRKASGFAVFCGREVVDVGLHNNKEYI